MTSQVIIRHVSGAKANRIEQFKLDGLDELTIGRADAATINFDGQFHDTVSRHHACIRIKKGHPLSFTIMDLGSSNGVWVNGVPVAGERELSPDDTVELGAGGPSFRFDVQPRPAARIDDVAAEPAPGPATAGRALPEPTPARRRAQTGRTRAYVLFAVLVGVGAGAGALMYWRGPLVPEPVAPPPMMPVSVAAATTTSPAAPSRMTSQEIAQEFARSTVYIEVQWRLYDKFTGKPVFQRMLTKRGQKIPCFVELANHQIVPWLSTDDEEHTNIPVGGEIRGSGVIISQQGAILTNKHIAAAWLTPYDLRKDGIHLGALFHIQGDAGREAPSSLFDLDAQDAEAARMPAWSPGDGGVLFRSRSPVQVGASQNNLEGRNEIVTVRLPLNRAATAARLVRASADADMAELKIDTDRPLAAAELAPGDAKIGDQVTMLGYPAVPPQTFDVADAAQSGEPDGQAARGPQLIVTSGVVAGMMGDIYHLTVAGNPGGSGGPVFDSKGRVAALFTAGGDGGDTTLYAYPIKFARALLQLQ
jgi:serine protease Do